VKRRAVGDAGVQQGVHQDSRSTPSAGNTAMFTTTVPWRRVGEGMEVASEDRLLRSGGAAESASGNRRISTLVGGRNESRGGDGLASAQNVTF
jgi:hypothetical protein